MVWRVGSRGFFERARGGSTSVVRRAARADKPSDKVGGRSESVVVIERNDARLSTPSHTSIVEERTRARVDAKRAGGQTARPSRAKSPNSPAYVFRTCPTLGRLRSLVRSTTPRPRAGSPRGVTRAARDVGRCDVGPGVSRVVPHPRGGAAPRRGGRRARPRAGGEAAGVVRVQGVSNAHPRVLLLARRPR